MTSTTDMAGHPDVAEISDLAEGLLPPARSTDVRRHLESCELCADVYASLEEIRGLLGTLPGPPRMPADVAGRIDAALAAEALLSATTPEERSEEAATSSVSEHDAPVSRETATVSDRPAGHARTATTGPGRKQRPRRSRRTVGLISAACAAAAVGLGALLVSTLTGGTSGTTAQQHQSSAADTFSEARLSQQVDRLLAQQQRSGDGSRTPHSFGADSRTGTDQPKVFRSGPTVPECVRRGLGRDDAALGTETGTFQGKDALLVVVPDASDVNRVDAYLMDATCVAHPSAGTAKVLLKNSYTRP
ncbi:anti-sigma factor family protein [Streptomyces sp. NPDC014006]|uniref:anti-sigma factor family protein n=1 Tax=Streptomyces sp. NPDC014006 TaxID=3364870 RepID=UPI0036FB650D